jgi:hypothetical protein
MQPPPYVPLRHRRWPSGRMPRWLMLAAVPVLAVAVAVGAAVHPSKSQRAADLNGFLHDMTADIESCAGGVGESMSVLRTIESGRSPDVATAVHVASYGAANCSPANNELLGDLLQYQVHESLAQFHLDKVVTGLSRWASPDAQRVMTDVAAILSSRGAGQAAAHAAATAKLRRDLRVLDAQRAYLDGLMTAAIRATSATGRPPTLPG